MKLAICNELFENWPFSRICAFARQCGYQGLELAPFTFADHADEIDPIQRREICRLARLHGLDIVGLHWLLVKPPGLHITHTDPEVRRQTADYFCKLVQLCSDLGGAVMVIGSPKQRALLPGVSRDQAMIFAAEVFKPCLDLASRCRVTLAIEPLSPEETDFLNTAAEAIQLIRLINHPHFRLHLDVKAMASEPSPIPDIIRASRGHLVHFHANDPNLLGPGMGKVDYKPIIAALREIGYDGWLSVEAFDFKAGAERIARESIAYLREVLSL